MEQHTAEIWVKIYSILFWIGAAIGVIFGLLMLLLGTAGAAFMASFIPFNNLPAGITAGLITTIIVITGVFIIIVGVLELFVGRGLWQHRNWARITAIVLFVFGVLSILSPSPLSFINFVIGAWGIYLFGFDAAVKSLFNGASEALNEPSPEPSKSEATPQEPLPVLATPAKSVKNVSAKKPKKPVKKAAKKAKKK